MEYVAVYLSSGFLPVSGLTRCKINDIMNNQSFRQGKELTISQNEFMARSRARHLVSLCREKAW